MRDFRRVPKAALKKNISLEEAKYIQRSCLKKRQYPNKNAAKGKAREAMIRGEDVEEYRCRFAKHYHIGHRLIRNNGLDRKAL